MLVKFDVFWVILGMFLADLEVIFDEFMGQICKNIWPIMGQMPTFSEMFFKNFEKIRLLSRKKWVCVPF